MFYKLDYNYFKYYYFNLINNIKFKLNMLDLNIYI